MPNMVYRRINQATMTVCDAAAEYITDIHTGMCTLRWVVNAGKMTQQQQEKIP